MKDDDDSENDTRVVDGMKCLKLNDHFNQKPKLDSFSTCEACS